jgi:hypothetical protein
MTANVDRASRLGLLIKLGLFVMLLVAANQAGNWVMAELGFHISPRTEQVVHRAIMTAMAIYVLLMALPFVPGIEIGLALMVMFGASIVPLVYAATVVALILGFLLGRLVPQRTVIELLELLRLRRLQELVLRVEPLDSRERLAFLLQNARSRWVPFLLKHRFFAVAVALNIPGNAMIGGGGGISFLAGFSRLFSVPAYALTVAVAVAPFPLLVLLTGG